MQALSWCCTALEVWGGLAGSRGVILKQGFKHQGCGSPQKPRSMAWVCKSMWDPNRSLLLQRKLRVTMPFRCINGVCRVIWDDVGAG